jgi:ribosomal protein S18 acetylase RimI-like enzyme
LIQIKQIRRVRRKDLAQVVEIDARITGLRKPRYWAGIQQRYGGRDPQRFFLVAEAGAASRGGAPRIEGYVVGEIRDWEFGSPPCGWVFGLGVRPESRLKGTGTQMLEAICAAFRKRGVYKVRTLLARDNSLVLAFFRSQGMMAAPFIALERDLAESAE